MALPPPKLSIGVNSHLEDYCLINSISMTAGRTNIAQQPSPSTFSCELVVNSGTTPPVININDNITWNFLGGTYGTTVFNIFYGYVTDIEITLNWGNGSGLYSYRITGVGNLAKLNRVQVGGSGYVKAFSGTRIASILTDAGFSTTGITTPGDYEIAVYNSGVTDALSLAQDAANSAMGCLYEDFDNNRLAYQTYTNRKTNPVITLSVQDILAADYGISTSMNDVANTVNVQYGAAYSTTYSDATSVTNYGVLNGTRQTSLHNLSDANSIAQILLATRSESAYNLTTVTINTGIISTTLRESLFDVFCGTRLQITGLPNPELTSFNGFVEGYTWTIGRNYEQLTMNISDYGNFYPYTLWNDLNATDTWNTIYTSTTKWSDVI